MLWWLVSEEHQTQLVLGAESATESTVGHDSGIHFGARLLLRLETAGIDLEVHAGGGAHVHANRASRDFK